MENDWEILDDYEWVRYWFVWLRILNNFINMVIWTFWTISMFYTIWFFFFTKEMHFLSYYVFLYSLFVNAFVLVYLDDYLYFSAEAKREEERRIRIKASEESDALYYLTQRTNKLIDKLNLYPNISKIVASSKKPLSPMKLILLLERERKRELRRRLQEIRDNEAKELAEKELLMKELAEKELAANRLAVQEFEAVALTAKESFAKQRQMEKYLEAKKLEELEDGMRTGLFFENQ